jgi:hypothetical protein
LHADSKMADKNNSLSNFIFIFYLFLILFFSPVYSIEIIYSANVQFLYDIKAVMDKINMFHILDI